MDYRIVLLILLLALITTVVFAGACGMFHTEAFAERFEGEPKENMPLIASQGKDWNTALMAQADRAEHDKKQCERSTGILGGTSTYLEKNLCSRPDIYVDDRVNINKNLDCRYYDDQHIENLIDSKTWCDAPL